jgi:CBS domain-containing protein
MQVREIISDKGGRVISVTPRTSIEEVSQTLSNSRIGAVVVTGGDGQMLGILSERDIIQEIAQQGSAALSKPAEDLMTREVKTCSPDQTVDDLMRNMVSNQIRHLPVLEDKSLVGIVSIGDVVRVGLHELGQIRKTLENYIDQASQRSFDED